MDNTQLLKKALLALKLSEKKNKELQQKIHEPIAIIGTSCRFPGGSSNLNQYWEALKNGVDGIRPIPADRWDINDYYNPDPQASDKMYVKEGGFIESVDLFDPSFFGITAREAVTLDPQQRLLLEVVWEALEQGGIAPSSLKGSSSGVYIGIYRYDYLPIIRNSEQNHDSYDITGNILSTAAGRISYTLGLQGPCMSIDTACSSSLVAVHLACQSLRQGESNLAIAGGVNLVLTPDETIDFCKATMLSPTNRCKTFDAEADGFVRSEGCGVVILKRLSDALKNNDSILAVIKGTAINQDGPSAGLTVPNSLSQRSLVQTALEDAGLNPSDIDYVETHGTGTSLGDPIEIESLNVLSPGRQTPLLLGSVKSNIGHTESAAGIASLIKVILAMQNETIPKNINFNKLNPHINLKDIPATIVLENIPWKKGERIRRAGISSFGISGTNSHIILEEAPYPEASVPLVERPLHLITLSAKNEEALSKKVEQYLLEIPKFPDEEWPNVCYTSNAGRDHFTARLAIIAANKEDFLRKLKNKEYLKSLAPLKKPKIAFLFTGQGAQYSPGMGKSLYETQPVFKQAFDRCHELFKNELNLDLKGALFAIETNIHQTDANQPSLFALEYSLYELWKSWGITPDYIVSDGLGEYAAKVAEGTLTLEQVAIQLASPILHKKHLSNDQEQALLASINQVRAKGCDIFLTIGPDLKAKQDGLVLPGLSPSQKEWETLLNNLISLYLSGFPIDWKGFDSPYKRRQVVLPSYPFQRERFWVTPFPSSKLDIMKKTSNRHPFLIQETHSHLGTIFETEINENWPNFIADHKIYEVPVVAGATYISTLLSAIKALSGKEEFTIENIEFSNPIIVPLGKSLKVQTIIYPLEDGIQRFEIWSSSKSDTLKEDWVLHVKGNIPYQKYDFSQESAQSLDLIKARCNKGEYKGENYHQFALKEFELNLGPHFHWIENFYFGDKEAIVKLRLPTHNEESSYILHPGFIDSSFQAVFSRFLMEGSKNHFLAIPFSIQRYSYDDRFGKPVWVQVIYHADQKENFIKVNLSLFNEKGRLIGKVSDFIARGAPRQVLLKNLKTQDKLASPFLETAWIPLQQNISSPSKLQGTWLVFAESSKLSEKMITDLREAGCSTILVSAGEKFEKLNDNHFKLLPGNKENFLTLFNLLTAIPLAGILDLWPIEDSASLNEKGILKSQQRGYFSFLYLLQALLAVKASSSFPHIWVILNNLQNSPLVGLQKVASLEHPTLKTTIIDLEETFQPDSQAKEILQELQQQTAEEWISYRKGIRYIPRMQTLHVENQPLKELTVDSLGSYLITGGLNGLGLKTAVWLAEKGARHLVLLGRRPPNETTLAIINSLIKQNIKVQIVQQDIADANATFETIKKFETDWPPLKGVFHAAGVLDDGALMSQNEARYDKVFNSKALGAWNLHQATLTKNLDYFVLFSSISSEIGMAGQSNYAAANAFLNALAYYRKSQGLSALSISWGPWDEIGMAASLAKQHQAGGLIPLSPSEGIDYLELAIRMNKAHLTIAKLDWNLLSQKQSTSSSYLSEMTGQMTKKPETTNLIHKLREAIPSERKEILQEHLSRLLRSVMGLSTTKFLKEDQGFFQSGMDSIMALEFKNKLQNDVGSSFPLPTTFAFDYPTILEISAYFDSKILPLSTTEIETKEEEKGVENKYEMIQESEIEKKLNEEFEQFTKIKNN